MTTSKQIIINFHGIGCPPHQIDPEEEPFWISVEQFEDILDLCAYYDGKPYSISLTFDDGNISDANYALPRILARGKTAKFFVLAGRLNTPGFLGRRELMELIARGMDVGTHGVSHLPWTRCNDDLLTTELDEGIRQLGAVLGRPVTELAIPFGDYDRRVISAIRSRRIEAVYTSDGGPTRQTSWIRPRTSVRQDTTKSELEQLVSSKYAFFHLLRQRARVLRKLLT